MPGSTVVAVCSVDPWCDSRTDPAGVRHPAVDSGSWRVLARWGYTPQKAARRAHERDDAAVKDWLSIEYAKVKALAKRENAEISWGDETGSVRTRVVTAATHRRAGRRS